MIADIVSILTLLVDIGILWILIIEFNFDRIVYEKEQYRGRSVKRKKKMEYIEMNVGEGR